MSLLTSMAPPDPTIRPRPNHPLCNSPLESDLELDTQSLCPEADTASLPATRVSAAPKPSRVVSWLIDPCYLLGRYGLIPFYFKRVQVIGQENLPLSGPVILAPTHRSRWDALMVPYAAGKDITGRHPRFMVSADEMCGIQGWLIQLFGGFPINTKRPAIASLRHGIELLREGEALVIFPEGNIFRGQLVNSLKPGLARLALQAESSHPNLGIQIVPISIHYSHLMVPWRCNVQIHIGEPLRVTDYHQGTPKQDAKQLTTKLHAAMSQLATDDWLQNQ